MLKFVHFKNNFTKNSFGDNHSYSFMSTTSDIVPLRIALNLTYTKIAVEP